MRQSALTRAEYGRQDSNLQSLVPVREHRRAAAPKAAVYANSTTSAWVAEVGEDSTLDGRSSPTLGSGDLPRPVTNPNHLLGFNDHFSSVFRTTPAFCSASSAKLSVRKGDLPT